MEPKNIEINGQKYQLTPIPASRALRLDKQLLTMAGPVVLPLLSSVMKDGEDTELDLGGLGSSVGQALSSITEDAFLDLLRELIGSVVWLPKGGAPVPLNEDEGFDRAFAGSLASVYQLAWEVLRYNRFSFFGVNIGDALKRTATLAAPTA